MTYWKLSGTFTGPYRQTVGALCDICQGPAILQAAGHGDLARVEELLRLDPSQVEKRDRLGQGLRAPPGSEPRHGAARGGAQRRLRHGAAATRGPGGRGGEGRLWPEAPAAWRPMNTVLLGLSHRHDLLKMFKGQVGHGDDAPSAFERHG